MTATAWPRARTSRPCAASRSARPPFYAAAAVAAGLGLGVAARAEAQVAATLSLASDYRLHGRSLSQERPTLSLDLSADRPSGLYLGATVIGVATAHDGPQLLGGQEYLGYARRLNSGWTVDAGLLNANYTRYYDGKAPTDYQDLYIGLIGEHLTGRLHYSPNYFKHRYSTVYAELDGSALTVAKIRLFSHLGVLAPTDGRSDVGRTRYDWQIGVSRRFRRLDLQLAWVGLSPRQDPDDNAPRQRDALVVALNASF